jgi:hypothetical protein
MAQGKDEERRCALSVTLSDEDAALILSPSKFMEKNNFHSAAFCACSKRKMKIIYLSLLIGNSMIPEF